MIAATLMIDASVILVNDACCVLDITEVVTPSIADQGEDLVGLSGLEDLVPGLSVLIPVVVVTKQ